MTLCFAETVVDGHAMPVPAGEQMSAMGGVSMDGHRLNLMAETADELPCHNAQMESGSAAVSDANCCDQTEMLRIDHSADVDFPVILPAASWLSGFEPAGLVDPAHSQLAFLHQSWPRLHLLLSVFLD